MSELCATGPCWEEFLLEMTDVMIYVYFFQNGPVSQDTIPKDPSRESTSPCMYAHFLWEKFNLYKHKPESIHFLKSPTKQCHLEILYRQSRVQ